MTQLHCPSCDHVETWIIDTRQTKTGTRRRYECPKCNNRFTTFEIVVKDRFQAEIDHKIYQINELKIQINKLELQLNELKLKQQVEGKKKSSGIPLSPQEKRIMIKEALQRAKAKMAVKEITS